MAWPPLLDSRLRELRRNHCPTAGQAGSVATLELNGRWVRSLNESDFQFKHTYNKAMEQTDFRTRRTPVRLAFADHMNRFIAGDSAPRTPERAEVLTRVDPTLDRAVVLLEHVIQIRDWPMP